MLEVVLRDICGTQLCNLCSTCRRRYRKRCLEEYNVYVEHLAGHEQLCVGLYLTAGPVRGFHTTMEIALQRVRGELDLHPPPGLSVLALALEYQAQGTR